MLRDIISNPWRVGDSDSEDEIDRRVYRHTSFTQKPSTQNVIGRQSVPIMADWDPEVIQEKQKRKFGRRRTAPIYENAPPDHKPIFYGTRTVKPSNSMMERNTRNKPIIAQPPVTPPASPPTGGSNFNPILFLQENLTDFIYKYIPKDYSSLIHCRLRRDRTGIKQGFFPTFYLHIERPSDGKKIFLLAARKVAKVGRQNEYLITTNIETLSEKTGGDGCVGKLQESDSEGPAYTLYDNGKHPDKYCNKHSNNRNGLRRELAGIIYNTKTLGLTGPREIRVLIPELDYDLQPLQDENTILDQWREKRLNYFLKLRNKSPKYDEKTKMHVLEFHGNRVVRSSVKNFQLVLENGNRQEEVVMQFGRIDEDTFTCDYRYPLSAIQAFGIALSSFDSRLERA